MPFIMLNTFKSNTSHFLLQWHLSISVLHQLSICANWCTALWRKALICLTEPTLQHFWNHCFPYFTHHDYHLPLWKSAKWCVLSGLCSILHILVVKDLGIIWHEWAQRWQIGLFLVWVMTGIAMMSALVGFGESLNCNNTIRDKDWTSPCQD